MIEIRKAIYKVLGSDDLAPNDPERDYIENILLPLVSRRISGSINGNEPQNQISLNEHLFGGDKFSLTETSLLLDIDVKTLRAWRRARIMPEPESTSADARVKLHPGSVLLDVARRTNREIQGDTYSLILEARETRAKRRIGMNHSI
ncbi:MAG TPA: hypothetical protein VF189_06990, partial [Patescibacteria group bacterium]